MIAVPVSIWLSLFTSTGLAAGVSPVGAPAPLRETACDPAWCRLARPTAAEFQAIVAEADRLLARSADVRMYAYIWRAPDAEGNLAAVTDDAHRVEAVPGTGLVHVARGYDALNPDRGMPAILQTARHEFAHLNGVRQGEGWWVADAAQVATACGPP